MQINADFGARAAVHSAELPWAPSPMPGVERRMLDRVGEEVARATTIVRYAPGSSFSRHTHGGGEEFLVLDGVFQDEHGDFPAGSYIRNPPTSSHTPGSAPGCTIFVKLWQFDPDDRTQVRIDTGAQSFFDDPERPGVGVMPLHEDAREAVVLERWSPAVAHAMSAPGGLELLVLEGSLEEAGELFGPQAWLRLPAGWQGDIAAGAEGARFWAKRGHLGVVLPAPD